MAWFAELAGKAENLLNNLDEQTGAALRNHNVKSKKHDRYDFATHPEPAWSPKKRLPRSSKKILTQSDSKSNYVPTRKPSPVNYHNVPKESRDRLSPLTNKKLPNKKLYTLNNCPKTLVGEVRCNDLEMDQVDFIRRRHNSLPSDLDVVSQDSVTLKMENLEVENAMLKNELNVMNREVTEILNRLRSTEQGEDVDSCIQGSCIQELSTSKLKVENMELLNQKINIDNESLTNQLEQLKIQINNLTTVEITKLKDQKQQLENELGVLKDRNEELEDIVKQLNEKTNEKEIIQIKIENDLRHAQSNINAFQNDLDKSNAECRRLEKDWETYKHRVKSMLSAKDKEIKALQEGLKLTEDTKILMEQIDNLRAEREELSEVITRVRGDCGDMKLYMASLETRHSAAERVVLALRDALKDERAARNRAETQCSALAKELKSIQIETGEVIANLRTALRDKENELQLRGVTSSSVRTTSDTSALNVADYDVNQDVSREEKERETEKLYYLTQKLVQSQGKFDRLLADNNTLRIQLEKLESKYKTEVQSSRACSHSVVHLHDEARRGSARASRTHESGLAKLSRRMDFIIRRNPIFRIFVIVYMIGLHFWVLTVLFTSTPENYVTRPTKS